MDEQSRNSMESELPSIKFNNCNIADNCLFLFILNRQYKLYAI